MGLHIVILNAEAEYGKNCLPKGDSVTQNSWMYFYIKSTVPYVFALTFHFPLHCTLYLLVAQ